jgi:hypothetical protein
MTTTLTDDTTTLTTGRRSVPSAGSRSTQKWSRILHVYTSMIALVVVLFFGVTGLTLNHPTWTFGDGIDTSTVSGTLPMAVTRPDGTVDFLSISEYVRREHGVSGEVSSFDVTNGRGSIAYKKAGYAAEVFFDVDTGTYDVTVEQQGWVAVMNDLHKGRDTGTAWRWVIDVAAVFLVVIALTGLVLQLVLRKRRTSAVVGLLVGGAVVLAVAVLTLA